MKIMFISQEMTLIGTMYITNTYNSSKHSITTNNQTHSKLSATSKKLPITLMTFIIHYL